ncbi:undecaprenyl-phosphate glucose phosphotransferase [Rhodopseudomonas sp.]|uniref:undecaprenyl-phosphate glucose phosphotransferase n=1 Tax=Rhodopseudomonas sp. TaxID=1078 RepID=UPI003B3B7734
MTITTSNKLPHPDESATVRAVPLQPGRNWLKPALIERLLPVADGVISVLCGVACVLFYDLFPATGPFTIETYASASLLIGVNFCLLMMLQDGYRVQNLVELPQQIKMTIATWTAVFAALLAIAFAMKVSGEFSRGVTLSMFVVGLIALLGWKALVSRLTIYALQSGAFANGRVVVISESDMHKSSDALLELRRHGYRVSRTLEINAHDLTSPLMMSAIAPRLSELVGYCRQNRIDQILLLMRWDRQNAIDSLLDILKILPIPVYLVPDANVSRFLSYPLVNAGSTWTAELRRAPLSWSERAVKRVIDIIGALVALVVFAPVMLVAAALIKLGSPGPVFFRQTRNGFTGRDFKIFKFRTMRVLEDGPKIVQATRNDPRVTWIGAWLRKTSIDELPQLFNVLKGEMSLVGPRPHATAHNSEYEQIIANYAFRHHVKPGITGLAQVNGYRGETNTLELMQMRVEYDLSYIDNWSVMLDIAILLKTLLVGFHQPSAY